MLFLQNTYVQINLVEAEDVSTNVVFLRMFLLPVRVRTGHELPYSLFRNAFFSINRFCLNIKIGRYAFLHRVQNISVSVALCYSVKHSEQ